MSDAQLTQAGSLFAFLKDILRLRHKPQKTIDGYSSTPGGWVHHLDETPDTKNGIEFWGTLGIKAISSLQGDVAAAVQLGVTTFKEMKGAILRFPRIVVADPPQPSEKIGPWIEGDFEDASTRPNLLEYIGEINEEGDSARSTEDLFIKDFPEIRSEYEKWIQEWDKWAEKVRQDQEIGQIYNSLFNARNIIKEQAEDWEFILGLGRLRLGVGTEKVIDRHLFTIPCTIDLDAATGTLFVRIDDSATFLVEDDWILGFEKPAKEHLDYVKEILDSTMDLDEPNIKKSLIQLAHKYHPSLITNSKDGDVKKRESLILAPSLILRKRSKQDLINLLEKLEQSLNSAENLPAPLISLLEPGYGEKTSTGEWSGDGAVVRIDESIYLPLALNQKQIQALEKADTRNATLIQGPPGTGKTRTIAVMVSHFLAKGQRVLVVAETSQALREVRTQLPDEIRDLAVSSLGGGKTDNDDLQKAVNALVEAHENRSELTEGFEDFQQASLKSIEALHAERALTLRKIIDLRSQEALKVEIEGFEGSPAHLAQIYLEQRVKFSWLNDISDPAISPPNFSVVEAQILIEKLNLVWRSPVKIDSRVPLPLKSELWKSEEFDTAILLRELKAKSRDDFKLNEADVASLLGLLEPAVEKRNELLINDAGWVPNVIQSALSFTDSGIRENIMQLNESLRTLESVLQKIGNLNEITCPTTSMEWLPLISNLISRIKEKGDLRNSPTGGIRWPLFKDSLSKNVAPKLDLVKIIGRSPTTIGELDRIEGIVEFDHLVRIVSDSLKIESSSIPATRVEQAGWMKIQVKHLSLSQELFKEVVDIREFLKKHLMQPSDYTRASVDLDLLLSVSQGNSASGRLVKYEAALLKHKTKIGLKMKNESFDFVDEYLASLDTSDSKRFEAALLTMATYSEYLELTSAAEDYAKSIFGLDGFMMKEIQSWINSEGENFSESKVISLVNDMVEGYRWKRLGDALGSKVHEDYANMFREIGRLDEAIEKKMRTLSKRRSWKKALDRISASTVSDMERYAFETRRLGKGTGSTAPRRKREIRKYLENCIPAIPAWITPISNVAKLFPAQLELFDVVIVDEASQARLDAIFLLALCKRVVIVGDHKQVSPDKGYMKDTDIQSLVKRHLGNETRAANWANPDISLFDECKMAFGGMVTLTEHRRCVPEIIGFSNQIAYIPENIRLIPVRQTGSDSLPPIKTIFVDNGYVRGNQGSIVNPPEVEAVISEVARMVKDSKYRGKTIGIITLQGEKQKELLRDRLHSEIDLVEIEKRQIRVGKPADFQGSERDIVLLSMVMSPERRFQAQTQEMMVQRYNVAMSRAKDQVVLVHSLRPTDISNQKDLRRQLIDYCLRVESGVTEAVSGAVEGVSDQERDSRFDSLFEQRVHNLIVGRGYKVIPQYEPQVDGHDYRIDLVVVGAAGKFAIECDGDFWHGPDEYERDLARQQTLERCGWRFFRIPESKFYSDPNYLLPLWPLLDEIAKPPVPRELVLEDSSGEQAESRPLSEHKASFLSAVSGEFDQLSDFENDSDEIDVDVEIEIQKTATKLQSKFGIEGKKVHRFPTKAELEALRVLREATAKKTHRFPTRAELEERRRLRMQSELASNSEQTTKDPEPSEDPVGSPSLDFVRGDGIGEIWSKPKGKYKLLLSHKDHDLLARKEGEPLDRVFSGRSKDLAKYWLEIRPMGGRVFIDDEGNATTYQGIDLIYLGNVKHIFHPQALR